MQRRALFLFSKLIVIAFKNKLFTDLDRCKINYGAQFCFTRCNLEIWVNANQLLNERCVT